ncbi:MAG: YraN family protein [Sandaracinus sp.]
MSSPPSLSKISTGRQAEEAVTAWLEQRGYAIVGRNVRVGRLELDVVARRGRTFVVCEVRSRRGTFVDPAYAFDPRKRDRVRRAALTYWAMHGRGAQLRLDAAAVSFDEAGVPRIDYFENVFCE